MTAFVLRAWTYLACIPLYRKIGHFFAVWAIVYLYLDASWQAVAFNAVYACAFYLLAWRDARRSRRSLLDGPSRGVVG